MVGAALFAATENLKSISMGTVADARFLKNGGGAIWCGTSHAQCHGDDFSSFLRAQEVERLWDSAGIYFNQVEPLALGCFLVQYTTLELAN